MNYLAHFVFNHDICGLVAEPCFALGVVLPDLWTRYSRKQRIRWRAVRQAAPTDDVDTALRRGLLNHVEVDRRWHGLPLFLHWQATSRAAVARLDDCPGIARATAGPEKTRDSHTSHEAHHAASLPGVHPAVLDFVAHMAVEVALDHRLLLSEPALPDRFYDLLAQCDIELAAVRVGRLGAVATNGLANVVRAFIRRRFLRSYRTADGLCEAIRLVLDFAELPVPPAPVIEALVARAIELVDPHAAWEELRLCET